MIRTIGTILGLLVSGTVICTLVFYPKMVEYEERQREFVETRPQNPIPDEVLHN